MTSIRTEPVPGPPGWRREDVEDPAGRQFPALMATHRWGMPGAAAVAAGTAAAG